MSSVSINDYFTNDKIREILQGYNDALHLLVSQGKYIMIVEHDLKDPRKFTIVKDNLYNDNKLEGAKLVFENEDEFKRVFPEFFRLPPVHIPSNMEQDLETGELKAKHKDPYTIMKADQFDDKIVLDMGKDIDIGAIWIDFATTLERFSVAVATEEQYNKMKIAYIPHLINRNIPIPSSAVSVEPEKIHGYNLSEKENELVIARYIIIVTKGRIDSIGVTKAKVITEEEVKKPHIKTGSFPYLDEKRSRELLTKEEEDKE